MEGLEDCVCLVAYWLPTVVGPRRSVLIVRQGRAPGLSGYVDQGREMAVPVTELQGLDAACEGDDRIVESGRSELRERPVAVLLPNPIQHLEAEACGPTWLGLVVHSCMCAGTGTARSAASP